MVGFIRPKSGLELELDLLVQNGNTRLVEFYDGLAEITHKYRRPLQIRNTAPGKVTILVVHSGGSATMHDRNRTYNLSEKEVKRYAAKRDAIYWHTLVHDLLEAAWRQLEGQSVEGQVRFDWN